MKNNLLIISTRNPYPVIGGDRLRIHNIIKLAIEHDYQVTVLCLCKASSDRPSNSNRINFVNIEIKPFERALGVLKSLFGGTPLQCGLFRSSTAKKWLTTHSSDFNLVIAHLVRVSEFSRFICRDSLLVTEMTDAISLNYQRYSYRSLFDWRYWYFKLESPRLIKYEKNTIENSHATFLVSMTDIKHLTNHGADSSKLVLASNGVELREKSPHFKRPTNVKKILFIGNLVSQQNQDMVSYFVDSIFPRIVKKFNDCIFSIAGNIPKKFEFELKSKSNIEIIGRYDDIENILDSVVAGICPMRFGAGIQNKILDYMSVGIPTVTTSIGNEGIDAVDGESIIIADDPVYFSSILCDILQNQEKFLKIGESGREFVIENFSWHAKLAPYSKLFRDNTSA